jgi:uncharacterized FlaG/YvyC family protein
LSLQGKKEQTMTSEIRALQGGQQAAKIEAASKPEGMLVSKRPQVEAVELPTGVVPKVPTSSVEFRSDAETGQIVVRVVNPDTGELLRQIPSQDAIALARALGKLQGSFLEQKA